MSAIKQKKLREVNFNSNASYNFIKNSKNSIVIKSGSKINLYLNVSKELRPDGYHEIKSIMQSISLSDILEFSVLPKFEAEKNYKNLNDNINNNNICSINGYMHVNMHGNIIDNNNTKINDYMNGNINGNVNGEIVSKTNGKIDGKISGNTDYDRDGNLEGNVNCNSINGIYITCKNICSNDEIPLNEKNLVHKAALLVLKKFDLDKKFKVNIKITKSIPVSSGLAGGSSNAAATLIALNKLFNLALSIDELEIMGNEVGSDVPFCISGGAALVEGKGEKITKLPDMPFYWVVIAVNGKKFSSGHVYERFDTVGKGIVFGQESLGNKSINKSKHEALLTSFLKRRFKDFFSNIFNDLEDVVATEDNMVRVLIEKALSLGASAAQMTGSGPAIFAICEDLITAKRVFNGLGKISNKVFLAYTTNQCQEVLKK